MVKKINTQKCTLHTLSTDCVIDLHNILSNNTHLLEKMDPVEPKGIKNFPLLESAVSRQHTSYQGFYKYPAPHSNCATLVFGIIKNHSFHNGNKRTAFLALIKHLYVNNYVLSPRLNSNELYEFLIAIAESNMQQFSRDHRKKYTFIQSKTERVVDKWDTDTMVRYMGFWIKKNSQAKMTTLRGEFRLSALKKVLINKGINVHQQGSIIELYIEEPIKYLRFFTFKGAKKTTKKRRYNIGNNRTSIGIGTLNIIRRDFNLTKADGVDNSFFYDEQALLDYEVKTFKELIYRLSKT